MFALISWQTLCNGSADIGAAMGESFLAYQEQQEAQRKKLEAGKIYKAKVKKLFSVLEAMKHVESRCNPLAYNKSEDAAGILQIRPIMVREVNRLVGYKKYKLSDRWIAEKAVNMFLDLQAATNPEMNLEKAARVWNGGYAGMSKPATKLYWALVQHRMHIQDSIQAHKGEQLLCTMDGCVQWMAV